MPQAPATQNGRTRQEWAAIINADWRKSIESILQTGRDLIAAKEELQHGEFGAMCEEDLHFSRQMASKLMTIARHPALQNVAPGQHLPASWRVLGELTTLSKEDFRWAQQRGLISSTTTRRAASALSGALKTPPGETWGEARYPEGLPTPVEARKIAAETGRFVSASDGNIYSGASEEETEDHRARRERVYGVRDAIELISSVESEMSPREWLESAEPHWLHDFSFMALEDAAEWLNNLVVVYRDNLSIFDAE